MNTSSKKPEPIYFQIPFKWKFTVYLFIGVISCAFFAQIVLAVFGDMPLKDLDLAILIFGLIFDVIFIVFCLPFFINRYPSWVVSLLGKEYIDRLAFKITNDFKKIPSKELKLSNIFNLSNNDLLVWIIIIILFFFLGLLSSLKL